MFRKFSWIVLIFLLFAVVDQGCSGDSGSSNPAGPGDGDDSGWSTQLVKSGNYANGEINVTVDTEQKLYVSAYESSVGLQYVTNKSGSWISTLVAEEEADNAGAQNDIAVDSSGKVHIVYSGYNGIAYTTDESGSWNSEDMWPDYTGSCSIVSDSDGNLHSAFDDCYNWDIRYAYKPAGGAWGTKVFLADQWTGSDCDIDIDSSDNPHVIFNFSGHYNLRYALFNSSWNVSTIEGTDSYPYEPDTGWTPAIAVNKSTDAVNIAYWNRSDSLVQFSTGAVNSAITLKDGVAGWARPCIALDNEGYAHVFFAEDVVNTLNYLNYATNRSGSWVNTVLSIVVGGNELAVTIDAGNKIHVLYTNYTYLNLYHASFQL
ncbi:MAG: hypothetical protein KAV42_04960 [Candidatus Krumholzibacteria bacterium]|nr:hypothetical protein [Candidatus Krumholzibacteria bacterium]